MRCQINPSPPLPRTRDVIFDQCGYCDEKGIKRRAICVIVRRHSLFPVCGDHLRGRPTQEQAAHEEALRRRYGVA